MAGENPTQPQTPQSPAPDTSDPGTPDLSAQIAEMRAMMEQQAATMQAQAEQLDAMKTAQAEQAETFQARLRETATGGIISRLGELDDETRADINAVLSSGITVDGETMQVDSAAAEARLARILAVGRRQALAEVEAAKASQVAAPNAPTTVVLTPPPATDPPTPKSLDERLDEHAARITSRFAGGGE